nr:hypothetical protein [Trebonia sp.]
MVDVTEILQHWYAGRPKAGVARSLGVDAKTVRRYVAAAEAAGMAPGGPPVAGEQWRALARQWFPQIAGTGIRQVSWREIAVHHDRIAALVGVVPVSVIHQRLAGEQGLEASVASVRRYVRAHFPDGPRPREVRMARPPCAAVAEAQVDYGFLGLWPDPQSGRHRRVWAFSMVLPYSRHLFIQPVVSMTQRAWTEAHVAAFEFFGGVPAKITPDHVACHIIRHPDQRPAELSVGGIQQPDVLRLGEALAPVTAGLRRTGISHAVFWDPTTGIPTSFITVVWCTCEWDVSSRHGRPGAPSHPRRPQGKSRACGGRHAHPPGDSGWACALDTSAAPGTGAG